MTTLKRATFIWAVWTLLLVTCMPIYAAFIIGANAVMMHDVFVGLSPALRVGGKENNYE